MLLIEPYFKIGSITITYYALCILTGVVVAFIFLLKEGKKLGISSEDIYLGTLISLPLAIIGARLWYVLFNISSFNSFAEVLGFRNGSFEGLSGLGIQGGVIVVVITLIVFSRKRGISLYRLLDAAMPTILIGQIFGRWGNFFNHELYGPVIQTEWYKNLVHGLFGGQMYISGAERHPVFFYEGTLNLCGVIFMFIIRRKDKKHLLSGDMGGIYLIWYGSVRIFTESLRLNSGVSEPLMMGPIPVSILTSVLFIIGGVTFLIIKRFKGPKEKYYDIIHFIEENIPDAILFDLDGTILNSRLLIDRSFVHTFEHFRPDHQLTDEELDSFFGPTLYQTFSRYSNDEAEIQSMISYYREYNVANHDDVVKLFPGVYDTLEVLHKKGFKLGVVSSKAKALLQHGLELFGIDKFMDVIVSSEDVSEPKPAPDSILYAIDILENKTINDSENEENTNTLENKNLKVLYVGDTLNDIMAAKAANIKSCGVLYIKNPEIMLDAEPDFVINKFNEILRICGV
ncbi:MAG: prolipoprotein diacylglyceryl transferase [Acholeplasmatales bacterium]|nr:prolipoprotein diacylglyceryl transferase [Acholeplasmatales bacterium]